MSKDHNNLIKEIFEFANKIVHDIRYGKGLVIVVAAVGFVLGAYYGFGKEETSMFEIMVYLFLLIISLPTLIIVFVKFDTMRSATAWRRFG